NMSPPYARKRRAAVIDFNARSVWRPSGAGWRVSRPRPSVEPALDGRVVMRRWLVIASILSLHGGSAQAADASCRHRAGSLAAWLARAVAESDGALTFLHFPNYPLVEVAAPPSRIEPGPLLRVTKDVIDLNGLVLPEDARGIAARLTQEKRKNPGPLL